MAVSPTTNTPAFTERPGQLKKKPNFLIVVCDQMVMDAIGAYRRHFNDRSWLCHWVDTPNLDELVGSGVSFMESHSTNPVCCPARSSMFTGRYAVETGVVINNIGIDESMPNMGQWFEQHSNYDRIYCGKWHAGGPWNNPHVDGPRKIPGFDTLPHGPDNWGRHMDYGISAGVEAYVRNHDKDSPFLVVAGFMDPHDICYWMPRLDVGRIRNSDTFDLQERLPILPPNFRYDFEEILKADQPDFDEMEWRNYLYDYCKMVERLDRNVGRLLQAVKDRGDDTLLFFTSDHGDGCARHGRISKWHPYDESLKVPFIVYGPTLGVQQGIFDTTYLVSGVDIMATVCDFAKIPTPPHCRGLSLRPLLQGLEVPWRSDLYIELQEVGRVIRSGRYKYVMSYEKAPMEQRKQLNESFLTRDGQTTKFITGEGQRLRRHEGIMFFDMLNDPWETRNLAGDKTFVELIDEHEAMLAKHEESLIAGTEFTRGGDG